MNKMTTKWLSGTAITLTLLGGSVAMAMPAAASGSVSQTVSSSNNYGDGHHNGDGRHNDRRNDRRIEAACNFLDRFFANDRRHHQSNDRWSNERWNALERWYDRHCAED